ncbi:MAG: AAA family ATPase [Candidatus Hodarchaeota archaeon]
MNILKIQLNNFNSHTNTSIVFKENTLYSIVGVTGSGKTSIIDGISYALFGQTPRGNGDELIKKGTNRMTVTLYFSSQGEIYIVKRSRGKSTELKLGKYVENNTAIKDLSCKTIKETQNKIQDIIGLNYDLYRMSICFEQGKSDSFSILTPTAAKQSLVNLLQLDIYNKCYEEIKKRLSHFVEDKSSLEIKKETSEEQLKDVKPKEEFDKTSFDKIENSLNKLTLILEDLASQKEDKYKLYSETVAEVKTKTQTFKRIRQEIKDIVEFKEAFCPFCEQALNEQSKKTAIEKKTKRAEELKKQIDTIALESDKFLKQLDRIEFNLKEGSKKKLELEENKAKLNDIKVITEHTEQNVEKLKTTITELKKELIKANKAINIYSILKEAFGKNGIQVYIINKVIPEIELTTNDLLDYITDGRLSVSLETQRESRTGDILDTFEIKVKDNLAERKYSSYSGGERFIIDFAIRMGLSILLSRRKGFNIETVIIDEGFGSLDSNNQYTILHAISKTITKYHLKKVILITHVEEIVDTIETKIKVEKQGDESRVIL